LTESQGWTGHCEAFFKNACHFKDTFREFEAFLKISILFEDIFRGIEAFLNSTFAGFFKTFQEKLRLFLVMLGLFCLTDFVAFKEIFWELEAFDYYCEAFIKITKLFENIVR
jgi:hypothetical protein